MLAIIFKKIPHFHHLTLPQVTKPPMLAKVLKYSKELDKSIEQIAKRQFRRWCLVGGADPSNVPGQMSFPPLAPTSPHHTFLGGIPVNLLVEVSLSLEPKRA